MSTGDVKETDGSHIGPLFSFESANTLVVDSADPTKTVTIGALAKAYKAEKLFAHAPFPKGSPPPKFSRKKDFAFVPSAQGPDAAILKAAQSASKVRALWSLGEEGGKLVPKGIVLVSTAAIPAASGDAEL